jgi:four helix bundle protein
LTDFKQLKVWQKAHDLTLAIYRTTSTFPKEELYGLTSQMRRCAVSIGSNIAEGRGRDGDPDFQRFIGIAIGSTAELEYQMLVSRDLGYLNPDQYQTLLASLSEVGRMLVALRSRIRATAS